MNNQIQAKNGFKTFVMTLSVSLILFSAIYYVASDSSASVDIEADAGEAKVLGNSVTVQTTSVFEDLVEPSYERFDAQQPAVLAGADTAETTQSTVPDTGTTEITMALVTSAIILSLGGYMVAKNPRKLALVNFEKRARRKA